MTVRFIGFARTQFCIVSYLFVFDLTLLFLIHKCVPMYDSIFDFRFVCLSFNLNAFCVFFLCFPICFLFARNQQSYDLLRTYVVCIANMYLFGFVLKHIDIHLCMYISIAIHIHKILRRLLYYSHMLSLGD